MLISYSVDIHPFRARLRRMLADRMIKQELHNAYFDLDLESCLPSAGAFILDTEENT